MECADSSRMEPAGGDLGKLVEKWNSMTQPMFCRALFRYKEFSNPGVVCSDSWTSVSMISAQGSHLRWNNSFSGWKVQLRWEQISDVLWATQRNPDPPDSILYSGCEFEQATSSPSVSNWSPGTYPWTCGEGSMQWELRDQIGSSQRVSVNGGNIALFCDLASRGNVFRVCPCYYVMCQRLLIAPGIPELVSAFLFSIWH